MNVNSHVCFGKALTWMFYMLRLPLPFHLTSALTCFCQPCYQTCQQVCQQATFKSVLLLPRPWMSLICDLGI